MVVNKHHKCSLTEMSACACLLTVLLFGSQYTLEMQLKMSVSHRPHKVFRYFSFHRPFISKAIILKIMCSYTQIVDHYVLVSFYPVLMFKSITLKVALTIYDDAIWYPLFYEVKWTNFWFGVDKWVLGIILVLHFHYASKLDSTVE